MRPLVWATQCRPTNPTTYRSCEQAFTTHLALNRCSELVLNGALSNQLARSVAHVPTKDSSQIGHLEDVRGVLCNAAIRCQRACLYCSHVSLSYRARFASSSDMYSFCYKQIQI